MAPSIRAMVAMAASMTAWPGVVRMIRSEPKVRKCSNPACNNENSSNAPYCSRECCRASRAAKTAKATFKSRSGHALPWTPILLLLLSLPSLALAQLPSPPVMPELPVSVQWPSLPTTPELRAALDRWREGFEARPASCAKCGLVCECGDCRCEAVKAKPTYTAAPANVECRNGRCYRVSPVQPVRQQATVRYVPQAAPVCRPGMPCYQQQSQPARGRLLPRFFR